MFFKGQVRGISHQGQEKTLHLKAGYIGADFPSFDFSLAFTRRTIHFGKFKPPKFLKTPFWRRLKPRRGLLFGEVE